MDKSIYENYAEYYINKFNGMDGLKITKKWMTENILHIDIFTDLPYFEFFMGIFQNMITFDGICVCDEGIEFDDIQNVDPNTVYKLFDDVSERIKIFIKEGLFIFAYKDGEEVVALSTDVMDREKVMKNFNIRDFYETNKFKHDPKFEELDRIELKDFYNNIIYEYNASIKSRK